jgi:hypothetical protein
MEAESTRHRGGQSVAAVRWTINRAAQEFGRDRNALDRMRIKSGIEPGADECFSTQQICAMIYGDKEKAAIKKLEAEARIAERKDAEAAGKMISVESAARINANIAVPIRQMILTSSMPNEERIEILTQITRLENVDFSKS